MELASDAPVGTDLRHYLELDDQVIDISVTPNRADCLGVSGIAREVGLLNNLAVTEPAFTKAPETITDTISIEVQAEECCPRYVGRVIKGIDISRPSPQWLQEKLRRCGVRSIDAVPNDLPVACRPSLLLLCLFQMMAFRNFAEEIVVDVGCYELRLCVVSLFGSMHP